MLSVRVSSDLVPGVQTYCADIAVAAIKAGLHTHDKHTAAKTAIKVPAATPGATSRSRTP